jgi:type 1 glutamine amidotransferase
MQLLAISLAMLTTIQLAAANEPKKPDAIRVLLVTGVDYEGHQWRETAPAIRKVLEIDKRFDVRIVEDPDFLASPAVADYDVIFLHFKNYAPLPHESEARENLMKLVKQGKGLVLFHFASGAFEDWPEFANLAGKVWDRKTSHDPRGPFSVKIIQPQHPIMRGMREFQANDELYTCLIGDRPVEVLATARSKVTGKDHPMAFVFEYGKGRVFHTPLGHDVLAIEMPGVAELIRHGCLWTAGREP